MTEKEKQEETVQEGVHNYSAADAYVWPEDPKVRQKLEWFQDQKLALMMHWGPYSQLGLVESWALSDADAEWARKGVDWEASGEEFKEQYFGLNKTFNPIRFEPEKWADTAAEAGIRYLLFTTKHHDGFCLFDSKYTEYKAANTKAGRDLVREYVDAVRAEGLKVGLYFTLLDWYHEDYPHYGDKNHPMRSHPECGNEHRNFERYVEYMHRQVEEICTNYGQLDLLWFDFSYDDMRGETWGASRLMDMVRTLQPQVIVDNRLEVSGEGMGSLAECNPTPYHGDFVSPEQIIPPAGLRDKEGNPLAWEACVTMNNHWGYCGTDHFYKPASMLIKKLVECVSKGGNMLLNVGPDAYGNFPPQSVQILEEIGHWMKQNKDSIYGCGIADVPKPDYGRVTRNGNIYYFHMFENTIGPVPLLGLDKSRVKKIRALADGHEIPVSASWVHSDYPDIVFASLGPDPRLPDETDYVLAVEMDI